MPKLRHRETGSVVDVPAEKVDRLYAMGYDAAAEKKAPAKKAASSKSIEK